MLLQTNSYIVPKEKRAEHARLLQRFRQTLRRLGCEQFEVYEQVGPHWSGGQTSGRFVQIMRFTDRRHQQEVQHAEEADPAARQLIGEFCDLINFPYQQQQGLFASGYYQGVLSGPRGETAPPTGTEEQPGKAAAEAAASNGHAAAVQPAYRPQEAVRPEPRRAVAPHEMTEGSPAQTPAAEPLAADPEIIEPDWVEPASLAQDIGAQDAAAGFGHAGDTIDEEPDDGVDEEIEMELYLDDEPEENRVN